MDYSQSKPNPSMGTADIVDFVVVEDVYLDEYSAGVLPQSPKVISDIKKWLQPTDYLASSSEYNKHLNKYTPGTGSWIQKTEVFRKWHDSSTNGSLWVRGIAGAGKSVLAAMIAQDLTQTERVPVLSFFFRQIIATNQDFKSLVKDWISMSLDDSPLLQARMKTFIDHRRTLDSITTNELWQELIHALVSMPKVYCIVDALDEMDIDQQKFLENLVNLGKRKPTSIKLLMTSRPLPRIETFMKDPSMLQIRLERSKVDTDIAVYVTHQLNLQPNAGVELRTAIKDAVGEKSQGSFLYARLMVTEVLDHLQHLTPDIVSIRKSLDWLPNSLEDMYNGMLLDHSLRSCVPQDLQLSILQWVTHSTRPLRLLELASMLDSKNRPTNASDSKQDTKAIVRAACGPLLEILDDETVTVIHHSFTEFLIDPDRISRPSSDDRHPQFPIINPLETHKTMAITCLNYLSGRLKPWKLRENMETRNDGYFVPPIISSVTEDLKMQEPFFDYASNNWYVHVREYSSIDQELFSKLDEFMNFDNHQFKAWVDIVWPYIRGKSKVLPLHVSAWAGLIQYTDHLLHGDIDSNCLDGQQRTPLSYACGKGYTEVVAILLEYVMDPNVGCSNGLKPIHYAAQGNHFKTVRLLLRAGVSPLSEKTQGTSTPWRNLPSSISLTPLMFACHAGGVESIHEMMPFLQPKDVNLALIWAAEQGKVSVVDLILKSPYISLDGLDQSYSALFLASSGRHLEVMRSLLQAGANPNGRSKGVRHEPYASPLTPVPTSQDTVRALGSTPLHALCGMRQNSRRRQNDRESVKKCFDLLLAAGCDINAINSEHRTALHYSISRSAHTSEDISLHNLLSFLLLENGANPSIADKHGDTPLHLLQIHTKSAQVLEALLRNGADLYARRPADGRTPIHNMLDSTYTLDIKTLLTHVTNWNVQDNKGDSPLHIVFANSQNPQDFVTDLLNAGADLSLKNKNGQVPHFALRDMSCKPSNPILPTLVAAGADLESRDNDGRTFLLSALNIKVKRGDTMYTIQRLLDLGVNINVVDNDGNGCLHLVCKHSKLESLVKLLVNAGVNPLATNHIGNTILHEALDLYSDYEEVEAMVSTLLELDISPSACNHRGRTPLHIACQTFPSYVHSAKRHPINFILRSKLGESINTSDKDGIRPIHIAATLSEQLVAELIEYGADPAVVTYKGKSVLHLSAEAKCPNTVGFLLEHFVKINREDIINSVDDIKRTPLHYACRSGRPETVALLLQFGAKIDLFDKSGITPLHACAEFEQDQPSSKAESNTTCKPSNPSPRLIGSRMTHPNSYLGGHLEEVIIKHDTCRVREIVNMLLSYGAELSAQGNNKIGSPLKYAIQLKSPALVDELVLARQRVFEKEQPKGLSHKIPLSLQEKYLTNLCNPVVLEKDIKKYADKIHLCKLLLAKGHYSSIESLPGMGIDFSPNAVTTRNADFMTILARFGYAVLFEKLGSTIRQPEWINGFFHANGEDKGTIQPYIITASRSELPNLDVMRVIVEKFGANVNIQPEIAIQGRPNQQVARPGRTALHILAESQYWWQTKGIEYLLEHGADVNLKNEENLTPLAIATSNDRSSKTYRRYHTIELLLKYGADPNLLDHHGVSYISRAMHDVRLVKLLLNHGADITLGNKPVLIAAIAAQDITTVKDLLDLGADCNAKWKSPKIKSRPPHNPLSVMKNTQYYPIHYAASSIFNTEKTRSTAIEIIKLLLTKGADVFLSYDDDDEVLRGTIIHHIFEHGGILQPFLEIPNLGLERRDHLGRTLLLAASCSTAGTFSPTCTNPMTRSFASREKPIQDSVDDPLPCHTLFLLGADLNVVDYQGNSAFHLLVNTSQKNKEQYCKTLTTFVSQAPKLVDKQNKLGATPFHLALQKYHWWTVKTLLNAGANPCLPDPEGNTPLHHIAHVMCTSNGSKELLKWFQTFLSFGISINSKNALGESPVFRYVTGSLLLDKWPSNQIGIHRRLFQPFKEAGADIFATNNEGQTLLHVIPNHVAYPGREDKSNGNEAVDTFEFIMEMGVDPMAEDIFQRTALDVAAACGNRAILALFRRG